MSKFSVTTPIYYINDKPHIGHAYCTIAADVLARYRRQSGDDVLFLAGIDENAQKTVNAAAAAGQGDIQKYTDAMAAEWQKTWTALGISHDRFIRTSSAEHQAAVYAFLKPVQAAGDIYKGSYEGLYCVGCEAFIKEDDLVDGKCPDHNQPPEKLKEDNYFFKLSRYQQALLDHIKAHPEFVQPATRRHEVVAFIERGLEDISVSRSTQKWGIPWPGDKDQVIYVWFDALINYLTGAGYPKASYADWWPADVQLVGKDIIKFHCVIWPAMLMSAGLPLPKTVFAHGFFTINGTKISKSLGNAIDPLELALEYGNDAVRYYLLREFAFGGDGDFSRERFKTVYTSDLANELGNLVQRTAAMITRYLDGQIGDVTAHSHDVGEFKAAMAELRFDRALAEIWELVKGLNQYIDAEKPWELAKTDPPHLKEVLAHVVADLLQIVELLLPFMPETSQKIAATFADGVVNT
ncbi:MAG TPA: methionine--tRNA ligase, partial [Candidatus Saccharimonadales bacterium]|nr:methionine--tRNA ligase [Candidatus Saccharimonadales bacterium]